MDKQKIKKAKNRVFILMLKDAPLAVTFFDSNKKRNNKKIP